MYISIRQRPKILITRTRPAHPSQISVRTLINADSDTDHNFLLHENEHQKNYDFEEGIRLHKYRLSKILKPAT